MDISTIKSKLEPGAIKSKLTDLVGKTTSDAKDKLMPEAASTVPDSAELAQSLVDKHTAAIPNTDSITGSIKTALKAAADQRDSIRDVLKGTAVSEGLTLAKAAVAKAKGYLTSKAEEATTAAMTEPTMPALSEIIPEQLIPAELDTLPPAMLGDISGPSLDGPDGTAGGIPNQDTALEEKKGLLGVLTGSLVAITSTAADITAGGAGKIIAIKGAAGGGGSGEQTAVASAISGANAATQVKSLAVSSGGSMLDSFTSIATGSNDAAASDKDVTAKAKDSILGIVTGIGKDKAGDDAVSSGIGALIKGFDTTKDSGDRFNPATLATGLLVVIPGNAPNGPINRNDKTSVANAISLGVTTLYANNGMIASAVKSATGLVGISPAVTDLAVLAGIPLCASIVDFKAVDTYCNGRGISPSRHVTPSKSVSCGGRSTPASKAKEGEYLYINTSTQQPYSGKYTLHKGAKNARVWIHNSVSTYVVKYDKNNDCWQLFDAKDSVQLYASGDIVNPWDAEWIGEGTPTVTLSPSTAILATATDISATRNISGSFMTAVSGVDAANKLGVMQVVTGLKTTKTTKCTMHSTVVRNMLLNSKR